MRKLIFTMSLAICSLLAIAQDKQDAPSFFIRVGAGYGQRLAQIPPQIDADGKDLYRSLRSGMHTNLQVGFLLSSKVGIGAMYSRFGSKADGISNGNSIDSKEGLAFAGVTLHNFIPISDKHDINFSTRIGPGVLYYNAQNTVVKGTTTTYADVSERSLGLFTGVGVDYKISNNIRFEINLDKTWGRYTVNKVKTSLEYIALGAGLRFQF
jgi:Outer membrane protein beta-barrel domain